MIRQLIPFITGAVTLMGMWAAGNHKSWAWALGLANQVLWVAFIVAFEAWGLLPLTVALVVVYSRNWAKWRREGREPSRANGTAKAARDHLIANMAEGLDVPSDLPQPAHWSQLLLPPMDPASAPSDVLLDEYREAFERAQVAASPPTVISSLVPDVERRDELIRWLAEGVGLRRAGPADDRPFGWEAHCCDGYNGEEPGGIPAPAPHPELLRRILGG